MADGVHGDEPEHTALSQQTKGAAEEMRDQIGIAMRAFMDGLQPREVVLHAPSDDPVFARERRIADDGVEPTIVAREDLRELDLPMKRRDAVLARAQPSLTFRNQATSWSLHFSHDRIMGWTIVPGGALWGRNVRFTPVPFLDFARGVMITGDVPARDLNRVFQALLDRQLSCNATGRAQLQFDKTGVWRVSFRSTGSISTTRCRSTAGSTGQCSAAIPILRSSTRAFSSRWGSAPRW